MNRLDDKISLNRYHIRTNIDHYIHSNAFENIDADLSIFHSMFYHVRFILLYKCL